MNIIGDMVQEARSSQHLLDVAAEMDAREGIRQGLKDVARRRTRPASQVFHEIRRYLKFVDASARASGSDRD